MECGGIDATELAFVDAKSRNQRLDHPLEIEEVEFAAVAGAESPRGLSLASKDHPQDIHFARQLIAGGEKDARQLKEPNSILMFEIFGGDGEQARQQRRSQHASVRLQRVAQSDQ